MSGRFTRDNAIPIVIALLCVLSVGLAAATLETAEPVDTDGELGPPPDDSNGGSPLETPDSDPGDIEGGEGGMDDSGATFRVCIEFLASPLGIGLVLVTFFSIIGFVYNRYNFSTALLTGWVLFPPTMLVWFLTTNCGSNDGGVIGQGGTGGPDPGQSPIQPVTNVPPSVLAIAAGSVIVVSAALLYRTAGGDETIVLEDEEEDKPELDQFAAAAGRAADRIEERNADVDNSVYRAWLEMTGLLNVDSPDTYSAGEFAEEAIALGMDESHVNEITRLFNEVRYGGKDADARKDEALSTLRAIESSYGDSGGGTETTDRPTNDADTEDTQ